MAYLDRARGLIDKIASQELLIEEVAEWFAQTILSGRVVHLFGSGHSRIMVEEMWPRYGSFPGFHPIVERDIRDRINKKGTDSVRSTRLLQYPLVKLRVIVGFCPRIMSSLRIKGQTYVTLQTRLKERHQTFAFLR